jgi:hypothetical protein
MCDTELGGISQLRRLENVNIEVLTRMETFAKECLKLFPEQRDAFFSEMVATGLMTAEEAEWVNTYVCYFRLFTDPRYYNAVKQAVGEMLWITFNSDK